MTNGGTRTIAIDLDVHRKIESGRVSFEESENDVLRRLLGIDPKGAPAAVLPRPRAPRSSGAYSTVLGQRPLEANSLKELLRRVILAGEQQRPGFIEELARQPTAKGRFIVARLPSGLYPRSPQLTEYAERLNEGWWYDGNVGKRQVAAYLAIIARMLKLPALPMIHKRTEKSSLTLEDLGLPP